MTTDFDRTMLLYDLGWGQSVRGANDIPENWNLILEPDRLPAAHAVVFHIPTAPDLTRIPKYPGQKWVAWSMECNLNVPHQMNAEYMRQFDLTMTYEWASDVPVPYFGPWITDALRRQPRTKMAGAPAVLFVSNADDRSGRIQYARELMQWLPVHSYGKSLRNRVLEEDLGEDAKLRTIAGYKFTLAFENAIAPDYVTEKFFQPLTTGSVPVYRGAPNVEEFSPGDHCYIDASRFRAPRELAEYLRRLERRDDEYEAYFTWKQKPIREEFRRLLERLSPGPFARLGIKLDETRNTPPRDRGPLDRVLLWARGHRKSGGAF